MPNTLPQVTGPPGCSATGNRTYAHWHRAMTAQGQQLVTLRDLPIRHT
ncbi:hypothetical protein [Streptomyces sp. NPDC088923]